MFVCCNFPHERSINIHTEKSFSSMNSEKSQGEFPFLEFIHAFTECGDGHCENIHTSSLYHRHDSNAPPWHQNIRRWVKVQIQTLFSICNEKNHAALMN